MRAAGVGVRMSFYQRHTIDPPVRPAPAAVNRTMSPRQYLRSAASSDIVKGIVAAELLPYSSTDTSVLSAGMASLWRVASMMRVLA